MKKPVLTLAMLSGLLITTGAQAAGEGAYVGGELGYGNIYQPKASAGLSSSGKSGGIAGRIFGGYQFSDYFGTELGFTKFSNATIKFTQGTLTGNGTIKSYAVDAVLKGIVPFQNGFNLFGKLGAAYLDESSNNVTVTGAGGVSGTGSGSTDKVLPTFGLGAGYDINQNFTTDLSWLRIQATGNTNLQSTDLITAGLIYNFG